MKRLLLLLLVCLLVRPGFAVEVVDPDAAGNAGAAVNAKSEPKKLISVDFPDTPLNTVLDIMSIKTGRKFVADGNLRQLRVSMSLKDVTADEALDALLDAYNLYYVRQSEVGNIYVIKPKASAVNQVTTVSKVVFLNYTSAKNMEAVVKGKLTPNGNVVAEEHTNTLIITDTADNLDKIAGLIKTLDLPTLQVLLEAKIIDVTMTDENNLGVNITNLYRDGKYYTSPLELYRSNYAGTKLDVSNILPETSYRQTFGSTLGMGGQLSVAVLSGDYSVQGLIEALKKNDNARLLTNPRLLVMNNNEATIDIVQQIPYVEKSITGSTENFNVIFKDVGIKLKVRPQISRDGTIILNVVPENSYQTSTLNNVPVINSSKSNTTFILHDGETAVIGGLIRETEQVTDLKVPLLGDIPLLGMLFTNHYKKKVRAELTIFITAKVMQ